MVRRLWILAASFISLIALLVSGAAQAAIPDPAPESHEVWLQPVLAPGSTVDQRSIERMVSLAAAWAERTSAGRWQVEWGGVRPALSVRANTCSALTREVALDRQRRARESSTTLYIGDTRDCPYRGVAATPGSWVLVPRVTPRVAEWSRTIAHELGHTLGLLHAGADTCPLVSSAMSRRAPKCAVDEYGDRTDPMGRGTLAWSLGPIARMSLGWSSHDRIADDGEYTVTLRPEDAVMVTDPVTATRYAIAYRTPAGGEASRSRGVHIYRVPTAEERDVTSVHLPWVTALSNPWGGRDGMAFRAPSSAVAIEIASVTHDAASVRITLDSRASIPDSWGPVFVEAQPVMQRDGSLRVPRAFDQSGVARYVVRVDGRVVETRRASAGLSQWTLRLPQRARTDGTVTVEAVDGAGNVTTVTLP